MFNRIQSMGNPRASSEALLSRTLLSTKASASAIACLIRSARESSGLTSTSRAVFLSLIISDFAAISQRSLRDGLYVLSQLYPKYRLADDSRGRWSRVGLWSPYRRPHMGQRLFRGPLSFLP